uniref:Uncharacterized protein n=1 Tax=Arundo donax TaxID=35708 RepID=A0A0A9BNU1_ARUDO
MIVSWFPLPLFSRTRECSPMHFRAHSVNLCTFALASAFNTSSPCDS